MNTLRALLYALVLYLCTSCFAIADDVPATGWRLVSVDSQELVGENGAGTNAIDGKNATIWHTQWLGASPPHPHQITVDLGQSWNLGGFRYLPRQDEANGRIARYEFYVSADGTNWGTAAATGTFANGKTAIEVKFAAPRQGRYVRLVALSEVNGNPWTTVAELNMIIADGGVNTPPNGTITAPTGNVSVNAGDSVTFGGSGTDADSNLPLTYRWQFGTGSGVADSTLKDPGVVRFPNPGIYTVTFTVTDALGLADPTPATVTVTVRGTSLPPDGVIVSPAGAVTINAGESVTFSGNGTDPDNNLPLSYRWQFGAGSGVADSTAKDPGAVRFDTPGTYTVTFTVTDGVGVADPTPATITVTVRGATHQIIPRTGWRLVSVDSQETVGEDGAGRNAFDGYNSSIWHTQWLGANPPHPHQIIIDVGQTWNISGFRYLPRQDGPNGRIARYEFYVSSDGTNWGTAAATGTFPNGTAEQEVRFSGRDGRYVRLVALSEVNGNPWTTVAELNVIGGTATGGNLPPDGVIVSPAAAVTIAAGETVTFSGSGTDPDNNLPLTYRWQFGNGSGIADSLAKDPGAVRFTTPGTYTVTFTVTDSLGLSDPTPATVTVTVRGSGTPPDGVITSPAAAVTINAGESVTFAGSGTDPDNNLPLSFRWQFGAGSGVADSTVKDPGAVQFNTPGTFTVSLTVTDALGNADPTPATVVVTVRSAAFQVIPHTGWRLVSVDSQETVGEDGAGTNAFDGNTLTIWHTQWLGASPRHPHQITVDLGQTWNISGFRYLPRQDGPNGRIARYEFYVSADGSNWGTAVATGTFVNGTSEAEVRFAGRDGRYVRLVALSEVNGNPWTTVAELNVLGTGGGPINSPPDGAIVSPGQNMTITVGDTVTFSGSGSDPDGNLPLSYRWQFGAGSGIADSTAKDPGPRRFDVAGTYTVTLTVTDALGAADPTPATVVITVQQSGGGEVLPDWAGAWFLPVNLTVPAGATNPVLTAAQVTDAPAGFLADPFMFHENGTWYMFFELFNGNGMKGDIGMATSSDGLRWTYRQIVLSETFHLSYPYVFKSNGTFYMIPETNETNSIRLYESVNFPYEWRYVTTLVSGKDYVDASPVYYNGMWWMFASDRACDTTYLFYSDNLLSGWRPHPLSPVVRGDASKARPGGRTFVLNNQVVRVAQNDQGSYGVSVRLFAVDRLSTTEYAEHEVPGSPVLSGSGSGWNSDGMHHLDPWWSNGRWLCATDGVSGGIWSIGISAAGQVAQPGTTQTSVKE